MEYDISPYAVGGATRPDSFSGMSPEMQASLGRLFAEAPPEIQQQLKVSSGFRSVDRQEQLWNEALVKYGSPEAARKWVAPPGKSNHNHGMAADLRFLSPEARAWVHQNAGNYGLAFPLSNEPWHVELASARGGAAPQPTANALGQPPAGPQQAPQPQGNALAPPQLAGLTQDPTAFFRQRNALAPRPLQLPQNALGLG